MWKRGGHGLLETRPLSRRTAHVGRRTARRTPLAGLWRLWWGRFARPQAGRTHLCVAPLRRVLSFQHLHVSIAHVTSVLFCVPLLLLLLVVVAVVAVV